jgi:hypothetical protein
MWVDDCIDVIGEYPLNYVDSGNYVDAGARARLGTIES